jgi:hypothetical protein
MVLTFCPRPGSRRDGSEYAREDAPGNRCRVESDTRVLLLVFLRSVLVEFLGIPNAVSAFYPSIFGAVLLGIGTALLTKE